ncbi:MAG: hypothetical protein K6C36_07625, partial [Clostridia bacterium]|nr:hypothetical protein [Clostridia bacterium]
EYSRGEGGFFLRGTVFFEDGGSEAIETDGSWRVRLLGAYTAPYRYDDSVDPGGFEEPSMSAGPVETIAAPIPPCEVSALPVEGLEFTERRAGTSSKEIELDKVYACYVSVRVSGAPARVKLTGYELPGGSDFAYDLDFSRPGEYHGMELHAVGGVRIELEKPMSGETSVSAELLASSYPTPYRARTVTSDAELDRVLDVCAHSLKYCRQSIHLDSPKHCEPLACTGDYYIETLMTAFTYGDMRLAAFDVRRTAKSLSRHDGRIFHTSYSLIWALMLWDVYMLTGERRLLSDCRGALYRLLARFDGYLGENGLIETPPDYMFVDWLDPDGINLHHPPKALGQTCLCMFYFGALRTAEKIYRELGDEAEARECFEKSAALRQACLANLWDHGRGLFFEGLNTPTPEELLCNYMPRNVEKRYYRRHANILAAYFGFFGSRPAGTASHTGDSADAQLLRRVIEDDSLGPVQPYFRHFLLDAVYRNGLREEYTLKLLDAWKPFVRECPKGLPEGFYKPTPDYSFDRSHAWAGTPAYALPLALSGLKITEPGFRRISLSPSSLGLERAKVAIPTPFGTVEITVTRDGAAGVRVPEGVELEQTKEERE